MPVSLPSSSSGLSLPPGVDGSLVKATLAMMSEQDGSEEHQDHPMLSHPKLKHYVADSNESMEFKLVRSLKDLDDPEASFHPEMSHQIFGEQEKIFGYQDLKIRLYYTACGFQPFLDVSFTSKVDPAQWDGVEPDSVTTKLLEFIPEPIIPNLCDFRAAVEKDSNFQPAGTQIAAKRNSDGAQFVIHVSNPTDDPSYISWYKRVQPFILWFIDGANYIDLDDPNWRFFTIYEKISMSSTETGSDRRFACVGFANVYLYYAYPEHQRPRISQFLVFPRHQKKGLGSWLLNTIHKYFHQDKVIDIAVEDPSDDFISLRDFVDCCNCLKLPIFQSDSLRKADGYSKKVECIAREAHKIGKFQSRRAFEILKLRATNRSNEEEYKKYRLMVKRRLYTPIKQEIRRAVYSGGEERMVGKDLSKDPIALKKVLKSQYDAIEEHYLHIIERLDRYEHTLKM